MILLACMNKQARMKEMTDKERLEIKHMLEVAKMEVRIAENLGGNHTVIMPIDIVVTLIQQAERVEGLELDRNDWKDEAGKLLRLFRESDLSHLEMKDLFEDVCKRNIRYKQALEEILFAGPIKLKNEIAEKALKGE